MTYEYFQQLKRDGKLVWDSNYPGGAWYYPKWGCHYNNSGQELRDIREYDTSSEGYTPFGDE